MFRKALLVSAMLLISVPAFSSGSSAAHRGQLPSWLTSLWPAGHGLAAIAQRVGELLLAPETLNGIEKPEKPQEPTTKQGPVVIYGG
jgi:hypothetical protein